MVVTVIDITDLHVVETAKRFVADRARELGGSDKDLGGSRDPILISTLTGSSGRRMVRFGSSSGGGWKANVEGNCYTISTMLQVTRGSRVLQVTRRHSISSRVVVRGRDIGVVLLARKAKGEGEGEGDGLFIIYLIIMIGF